ncbi:MAG: glycosyltransferase family 2 protein [Anaerolineales bacterium]|nr:glycosyltransferase family 2 protein [Anaerolineales bacterium]
MAVIVTWNKRAEVLRCIESVMASTHPLAAIVVVDNASTDDTAATIRERFGQTVHLVVNSSNKGGSGGFYEGIAAALKYQPEYLWLLDNDVIVAPDALSQLLRVAAEEPQAGIVGSKVYFAQAPQVIWSMGARVNHQRAKISIVGDKVHDEGQFDQLIEVDYVPLCSMLLAVQVIHAIGSVDPAYFVYCDDLDFCTRAKQAGFRVLNAPGSIVWHDITLNSNRMSPFALYYYTRNYIYYFLKFAPAGYRLVTAIWLLVFMLKRLLATVRYWPGFTMFIRLEQAALAGCFDGWRAKRGKVY